MNHPKNARMKSWKTTVMPAVASPRIVEIWLGGPKTTSSISSRALTSIARSRIVRSVRILRRSAADRIATAGSPRLRPGRTSPGRCDSAGQRERDQVARQHRQQQDQRNHRKRAQHQVEDDPMLPHHLRRPLRIHLRELLLGRDPVVQNRMHGREIAQLREPFRAAHRLRRRRRQPSPFRCRRSLQARRRRRGGCVRLLFDRIMLLASTTPHPHPPAAWPAAAAPGGCADPAMP